MTEAVCTSFDFGKKLPDMAARARTRLAAAARMEFESKLSVLAAVANAEVGCHQARGRCHETRPNDDTARLVERRAADKENMLKEAGPRQQGLHALQATVLRTVNPSGTSLKAQTDLCTLQYRASVVLHCSVRLLLISRTSSGGRATEVGRQGTAQYRRHCQWQTDCECVGKNI